MIHSQKRPSFSGLINPSSWSSNEVDSKPLECKSDRSVKYFLSFEWSFSSLGLNLKFNNFTAATAQTENYIHYYLQQVLKISRVFI